MLDPELCHTLYLVREERSEMCPHDDVPRTTKFIIESILNMLSHVLVIFKRAFELHFLEGQGDGLTIGFETDFLAVFNILLIHVRIIKFWDNGVKVFLFLLPDLSCHLFNYLANCFTFKPTCRESIFCFTFLRKESYFTLSVMLSLIPFISSMKS